MANNTHLDMIRQRVRQLVDPSLSALADDVVSPTPEPTPEPVPAPAPNFTVKKLDSSVGIILMGIAIVIFSIVLVFIMAQKKSGGGSVVGLGPNITAQENRAVSSPERSWANGLNSRINALEEQQKLWAYRTWLLAVISNENATSQNKLTLDDQWKLNRPPATMQLNQEQLQELRRSLKSTGQ